MNNALRKNLYAAFIAPAAVVPATAFLFIPFVIIEPLASAVSVYVVGLFGLFFSVLLTFFYGLPCFLLLGKFRVANLWTALSLAFIPAVCTLIIEPTAYWYSLGFAYYAAAVAITYWWVYLRA